MPGSSTVPACRIRAVGFASLLGCAALAADSHPRAVVEEALECRLRTRAFCATLNDHLATAEEALPDTEVLEVKAVDDRLEALVLRHNADPTSGVLFHYVISNAARVVSRNCLWEPPAVGTMTSQLSVLPSRVEEGVLVFRDLCRRPTPDGGGVLQYEYRLSNGRLVDRKNSSYSCFDCEEEASDLFTGSLTLPAKALVSSVHGRAYLLGDPPRAIGPRTALRSGDRLFLDRLSGVVLDVGGIALNVNAGMRRRIVLVHDGSSRYSLAWARVREQAAPNARIVWSEPYLAVDGKVKSLARGRVRELCSANETNVPIELTADAPLAIADEHGAFLPVGGFAHVLECKR